MAVCPRCHGADQVQSVRDIYETGTSNIQMGGVGYGVGHHFQQHGDWGWGVGVAGFRGTQQTQLAKKLEPPQNPVLVDLGGIAVCGFISYIFFTTITWIDPIALGIWAYVLGVVLGVLGILFAWGALACLKSLFSRSTYVKFEGQKNRWNNACYCHRCGLTF